MSGQTKLKKTKSLSVLGYFNYFFLLLLKNETVRVWIYIYILKKKLKHKNNINNYYNLTI